MGSGPLAAGTTREVQPAADPELGEEALVVADQQQGTPVRAERLDELADAVEIKIVGRLVEHQQLRRRTGEQDRRERRAEALAAGQRAGDLLGAASPEQQARELRPDVLVRASAARWATLRSTVAASSRTSRRCGR